MSEDLIGENSLLTSHEVGDLLQVTPGSIGNWVKAGRIEAFRTPGGHIRIKAADLVRFLESHKMAIPPVLTPIARRRVLIVDDEIRLLKALRRSFKPHSDLVEVQYADVGIDALVMVGAFRPHLVILDVFMPDVDGIEVCRRLKARSETRDIELLVVSGQATKTLEKEALEAGATSFLPKPYRARDVLEHLGLARKR